MSQIFYGSVASVVNIVGNVTQTFSATAGPMLIGSGKGSVQARKLNGTFDSLELTGATAIEVRRADHCSIEIHGENNLIEFVETELIGSTLHVGIKRGVSFSSHMPLKVVATASVLSLSMFVTF